MRDNTDAYWKQKVQCVIGSTSVSRPHRFLSPPNARNGPFLRIVVVICFWKVQMQGAVLRDILSMRQAGDVLVIERYVKALPVDLDGQSTGGLSKYHRDDG